jgi:hypothetical protein
MLTGLVPSPYTSIDAVRGGSRVSNDTIDHVSQSVVAGKATVGPSAPAILIADNAGPLPAE